MYLMYIVLRGSLDRRCHRRATYCDYTALETKVKRVITFAGFIVFPAINC